VKINYDRIGLPIVLALLSCSNRNCVRFIFVQVAHIVQKQVSLIESKLLKCQKPKSFINKANNTERN
jgi:hypothetical protein